MLARLGQVIYWTACGLAALIVVIVAFNCRTIGGDINWWAVGAGVCIAGLVVWLLGRATLYVLSAK